jgi:DNA-binding transcriptional regulator GbsR (MarR family)
MKNVKPISDEIRLKLVDTGGRLAQDIGMSRIVGQVVVYLYLIDGDCSMDKIEKDLGLSKAAVSIAARQLETLGLIKRTWKRGDRKTYYRTAENIAQAFQQGLNVFLKQKMQSINIELDSAIGSLDSEIKTGSGDADIKFLEKRLKRTSQLRDKFIGIIDSPLLKFFLNS